MRQQPGNVFFSRNRISELVQKDYSKKNVFLVYYVPESTGHLVAYASGSNTFLLINRLLNGTFVMFSYKFSL